MIKKLELDSITKCLKIQETNKGPNLFHQRKYMNVINVTTVEDNLQFYIF